MGEVVLRERHVGHTLGHVTLIFLGKRHLAIFPMPQCEHLGKITRGDQPRTRFRPPRQNLQIGIGTHIALIHARKTGMRLQCDLVEPIGQEAILVLQVLGEHTEDLLGQIHLMHAIPLVQRTHRAPAQVHGGKHVRGRPIENPLELLPVIDLLERHMLHRGARHHKTVVIVVLQRVKRLVELHQVIGRHMRRLVGGGLHEVDLHLQRALGDEPEQLCLGLDLLRHKIQDHQFERADALTLRLGLLQSEDALRIEDISGRQATGDLDRHGSYYAAQAANSPDDIHDTPIVDIFYVSLMVD